ncbi:MAG: hypothetical protein Q9182_001064 [Xanthomendoza sp. 2 TL-2023]
MLNFSHHRNVALGSGRLVERDVDQRFDFLVKKGGKYYDEGVLPAFDGHSPYSTPSLEHTSLKANGWSQKENEQEPLPMDWRAAFRQVPESNSAAEDMIDEESGDADVVQYQMIQDSSFTNADGKPNIVSQFNPLLDPKLCAGHVLSDNVSQLRALGTTPYTSASPVPSSCRRLKVQRISFKSKV